MTLFCFMFLSFSHLRSWETKEILYRAILLGQARADINASELIMVQLTNGPEASYLAKHIIECAQSDVRYHCFFLVSCHQCLSVKLRMDKIKTRFINKSAVYYGIGKPLVCKKSTIRSNYRVLRTSCWIPEGHLRQHIVRPHRRCRNAQDSNLRHPHTQEHLQRCTHP